MKTYDITTKERTFYDLTTKELGQLFIEFTKTNFGKRIMNICLILVVIYTMLFIGFFVTSVLFVYDTNVGYDGLEYLNNMLDTALHFLIPTAILLSILFIGYLRWIVVKKGYKM